MRRLYCWRCKHRILVPDERVCRKAFERCTCPCMFYRDKLAWSPHANRYRKKRDAARRESRHPLRMLWPGATYVKPELTPDDPEEANLHAFLNLLDNNGGHR